MHTNLKTNPQKFIIHFKNKPMQTTEKTETILVIDDQEPFCRSVQRLLGTPLRRVSYALDGRTGLETAIRDTPQLIFLDLMMDGMDGIETLRHLADHPATCGIPVTILTACDDADMIRRAIHRRPDQFLQKPVNPEELLKIADRWLTLSRLERDATNTGCHPHDTGPSAQGDDRPTTQQELQRILNQAQKMELLGTLACGATHDFNNLIMVIMGEAELCLDEYKSQPDLAQSMSVIIDASARAKTLTRQLLAMGRDKPSERRILRLDPLIGESVNLYRKLMGKSIALDFAPGAEGLSIEANADQIGQILGNLLINARDAVKIAAGKTSRWIKVKTGFCRLESAKHGVAPGTWATFSVSDSGVGMDAETRDRIFDPFFTTKSSDQGSGFGLPTIRGIVNANQGHVSVQSEPGMGSVFTVYWPLADAPVQD